MADTSAPSALMPRTVASTVDSSAEFTNSASEPNLQPRVAAREVVVPAEECVTVARWRCRGPRGRRR